MSYTPSCTFCGIGVDHTNGYDLPVLFDTENDGGVGFVCTNCRVNKLNNGGTNGKCIECGTENTRYEFAEPTVEFKGKTPYLSGGYQEGILCEEHYLSRQDDSSNDQGSTRLEF